MPIFIQFGETKASMSVIVIRIRHITSAFMLPWETGHRAL